MRTSSHIPPDHFLPSRYPQFRTDLTNPPSISAAPQPPRASPSVLAAGIVAILSGACGFLLILFSIVFLDTASLSSARPIPPALRPILYGTWIFFLIGALFVLLVGIQVIRLRNWARVALIVIAGCMLFFGVIGIGIILFTIFVSPIDPSVSKSVLATVLVFIYGIPVVIALWWLILFTRPSVTAQFQAATASAPPLPRSASILNNPQCPLAIRIVAWYLASFVLALPFLPFLPFHVPAFYFGHLFRGPAASFVLFLNFAILSITGIGLLLLKRWSYPLTIVSQLLFCVNGLFAALSPSFELMIRSVMADMNLPDLPYLSETMWRNMRYFNLLGLVVPVAIVVTLLLFRRSFYSAANPKLPASIPPAI